MKNYLFIGLFGLLLTAGSEVESTPLDSATAEGIEGTMYEVPGTKSDATMIAVSPKVFTLEIYEKLGYEMPSRALRIEAALLKVPIYSVPLPNENKIVLVKDPKGFVERAIRHKMEFLAIKPSDKGEYWELMPVFANEAGGLSFDLKKSEDPEGEESDEEPLRIVPVKDFIRYN